MNIHSFIDSSSVICWGVMVVRVIVYPAYPRNSGCEMGIHHRAPCAHSFTPRGNLAYRILIPACLWEICRKPQRKFSETQEDHGRHNQHINHSPSSGDSGALRWRTNHCTTMKPEFMNMNTQIENTSNPKSIILPFPCLALARTHDWLWHCMMQ